MNTVYKYKCRSSVLLSLNVDVRFQPHRLEVVIGIILLSFPRLTEIFVTLK